MPGSAWADAWGDAWGDSWGTVGAAPPAADTPVTTAGPHRGFGTQYRAKTISRELRDEARKAAKKLKTKVVAALRQESWFAVPEMRAEALSFVQDQIQSAFVPQFLEEGTGQRIMDAALAYLIREARIRAEQDDDDLLLVSNSN